MPPAERERAEIARLEQEIKALEEMDECEQAQAWAWQARLANRRTRLRLKRTLQARREGENGRRFGG